MTEYEQMVRRDARREPPGGRGKLTLWGAWSLKCFNLTFVWAVLAYVVFNMSPEGVFRVTYYDPGEVRFLDVEIGASPVLDFHRVIHRHTHIRYYVVVRSVKAPGLGDGTIVCEGGPAQPFVYLPASGPLVGKDLDWWLGSDACANLPDGGYWANTCWTLTDPLGDLFSIFSYRMLGPFTPTRTICTDSNVFFIGPRPQEQRLLRSG